MLEKRVTITNKLGLHLRAAALLVKAASEHESDNRIRRDSIEVDAKSLMGVLGLEGAMGVEVVIKVDGPDEKDALRVIVGLFQAKFNEGE
jgi:phosphocarrier protein HPr